MPDVEIIPPSQKGIGLCVGGPWDGKKLSCPADTFTIIATELIKPLRRVSYKQSQYERGVYVYYEDLKQWVWKMRGYIFDMRDVTK